MNARLPTFYRRTADELSEDFETAVINAMPAARKAIIDHATSGHVLTLSMLFEEFCQRITEVEGQALVRTALNGDAEVTAKMLLDLISKGIEDEAENEAIKAVERAEVV